MKVSFYLNRNVEQLTVEQLSRAVSLAGASIKTLFGLTKDGATKARLTYPWGFESWHSI
jgi:hypothetical protein